MSYTSNQINSQSLNGIISLSDGVLDISNGVISNIQSLNVIGNTELDGDLVVDGKITCAYNAILGTDVVNKTFVDDALNNSSKFLRVDGTNKMNANLNAGTNHIYNVLDPTNDQHATTKFYTDTADNLRLSKSGGVMTGTLDMSGNSIINLPAGNTNTDAVNKGQMDTADNLRLLKSGGIMTGDLDMSGNNIININNLASKTATYLHLLLGSTIIMQLTPEQVIFKTPILINNIAVGGTGIYMAGTKIANLSNGTNPQDAINKQQMDDADNLRFRIDGSSAMIGNINCNGNNITNVGSIQSQTASNLNLQIGSTNVMQLQSTQIVLSQPINMGSKLINSLGAGVSDTDAVNKLQMVNADNLKLNLTGGTMSGDLNMNSKNITNLNAISSALHIYNIINNQTIIDVNATNCQFNKYINIMAVGTGINLNNTSIELCKSINGFTNSNLLINYYTGSTNLVKLSITSGKTLITDGLTISNVGIDMSGNAITNLPNGSSALDAVNKSQLDLKLNLSGGTLSNTLTFSGGELNMANYNITNVSNIHSNGLNPIYLNNNAVAKVKIDSSGLTMQSGNINMNGTSINSLANSIVSGDAVNRNEIATSLIPLTAWRSGDVIQRVLKGNWLGQTTNNNTIGQGQVGGLSSTYASSIFYSFSFTPKSTTSIIYITFDGNCTMATGGNSADSFKSYIGTYNGVTTQDRMLHNTYTGSVGMRGTSCFPISATWNNTSLTTYTIGCYFDLQAADDTLTFTTQWSMKLEEIKI